MVLKLLLSKSLYLLAGGGGGGGAAVCVSVCEGRRVVMMRGMVNIC